MHAFRLFTVLLACVMLPAESDAQDAEHVVLLHGLGRSPRAMKRMAEFLKGAGYITHNVGYPSRDEPAAKLLEYLGARLDPLGETADRVHFVTHSAGGIMTRGYLAARPDYPVGRAVFLSPPNQGSQLATEVTSYALVRAVMGPLARELRNDPNALPRTLPPPYYPVGILTGSQSYSPLSWLIPGTDDGIVAVEEARLEGMADFLVLHRNHTWIMNSADVQYQTLHFLKHGKFRHEITDESQTPDSKR